MSDHGTPMRDPDTRSTRLCDTHVHLNLEDYASDRDAVIRRALEAGLEFMVNVGFNLSTSLESVALSREHDFIYASVGVHPHDASDLDENLLSKLRELLREPRVVAVGETGLDYYRDLSPREEQRGAFRRQIRLARDEGLPLIIHNRDALDDVLDIMDEEGASEVGGVMHCFPGDAAYARKVVERGFHVGIGGQVTYSPKGRLVDVAREVPGSRLLLETDAPWLAPEPHRGRARKRRERPRNEPAYVAEVASKIAAIRDMDVRDLARTTTGNAVRLFGIAPQEGPSIAYEMWGNLYLNITNRCTNECGFCIRYESDTLWGYCLKLKGEPNVEELLDAIGDASSYHEVVFCGYGEPTVRLDVVLEVGRRLREAGVRVRLDTNGHGNLIWNRNIAPELARAIDAVSVSLNAPDADTYSRLCHPRFGDGTFEQVVSFIRECKAAGIETVASMVSVPGVDVEATRRLATDLGVPLKVRGGAGAQ